MPTAAYRGAHFATFPARLIERPILATCPERICVQCDRPWVRPSRVLTIHTTEGSRVIRKVGELARCDCFAPSRPGVVLDPFFGTGTVGAVAARLDRDWLGIELNPAYRALARDRLGIGTAACGSGWLDGGRKGAPFCPPRQPSTTSRRSGHDQGPADPRAHRRARRRRDEEGRRLPSPRRGDRAAGQVAAGRLLPAQPQGRTARSTRPRTRETTPADAFESAKAVLANAIEAIDAEIEAAKQRADEAKAEYEVLKASATERKQAIKAKLDALSA